MKKLRLASDRYSTLNNFSDEAFERLSNKFKSGYDETGLFYSCGEFRFNIKKSDCVDK